MLRDITTCVAGRLYIIQDEIKDGIRPFLGLVRRPVELAESLVEHLGRVALEVGLARLHGEALGGRLPEDVDVHVLVGGHPLRGPGT